MADVRNRPSDYFGRCPKSAIGFFGRCPKSAIGLFEVIRVFYFNHQSPSIFLIIDHLRSKGTPLLGGETVVESPNFLCYSLKRDTL